MDNKIVEALKKVYHILEENNVFWILSGSVSLAIQGVDVVPNNDIDILTDETGSKKIDLLLKQYCIQSSSYSSTEKYRSYFGIYKIDDVQVEIMGNFQYKLKNGEWSEQNQLHPVNRVTYEKMNLPVLSLEQEIQEYKNMDRLDKVEKIEKCIL